MDSMDLVASGVAFEGVVAFAAMKIVAMFIAADVVIKACPFDHIRARTLMNRLAGLRR